MVGGVFWWVPGALRGSNSGPENSRLYLKKRKCENGKFELTAKPLSSQRPLALRVMPFRAMEKMKAKRTLREVVRRK